MRSKARFVAGGAKRKELLAEMKECNERLENLLKITDTVAHLESKRSQRPSSATSVPVHQFWRHADRLYQILSNAWSCQCASQHRAIIILKHTTLVKLEFMLFFMDSLDDHSVASSKWQMREVRVELLDPPSTNKMFTQITIPTSNQRVPMERVHGTQSKTVRMARITSSPSAVGSAPTDVQSRLTTNEKKIQDLCNMLASNPRSPNGCGFLEDTHKRYYIYPTANDISSSKARTPISLDDLLRQKHSTSLNRRQRYTLALTLASSFIQLWESAWLPPASWSRGDILFPRDANDSTALLLDRPYLNHKLVNPTNPQSRKANDPSDIPFLGILLLELCFGVLLEETPHRRRLPHGNPKTDPSWDRTAAQEWLSNVVDEAGQDYAEAVTWCLLGHKILRNRDDWRRPLFEQVVQPIESCVSSLNITSRRITRGGS